MSMDPHSQYQISSSVPNQLHYYTDAHCSQDAPKASIWPEMAGLSMVHHARYRVILHEWLCMLNNFMFHDY